MPVPRHFTQLSETIGTRPGLRPIDLYTFSPSDFYGLLDFQTFGPFGFVQDFGLHLCSAAASAATSAATSAAASAATSAATRHLGSYLWTLV